MSFQKENIVGKPVSKIQRSDAGEIKKLLNTDDAYMVGIRLYLVYLVSLGHSSRKLSELHNISFKQITNWVHRFEKEGIEGLKDKKGLGRRSALSNEQLERLKELTLEERPADHGYQSGKWTGPLLADWIKKEYGRVYQKAQVYKLLEKVKIAFEKKQGLVCEV